MQSSTCTKLLNSEKLAWPVSKAMSGRKRKPAVNSSTDPFSTHNLIIFFAEAIAPPRAQQDRPGSEARVTPKPRHLNFPGNEFASQEQPGTPPPAGSSNDSALGCAACAGFSPAWWAPTKRCGAGGDRLQVRAGDFRLNSAHQGRQRSKLALAKHSACRSVERLAKCYHFLRGKAGQVKVTRHVHDGDGGYIPCCCLLTTKPGHPSALAADEQHRTRDRVGIKACAINQ